MFVHLHSLHAIRSASNYQHQPFHRPIGLLLFWVRYQTTCSGEEDFRRTKAKNWINDVEWGEEKQSSQLEEPSGSLFSWIPVSPGWRWYFVQGHSCPSLLFDDGDWLVWPSFTGSWAILTHDGPPGSCCADGWLGKTFCNILYFCVRRRWPTCDPHNKVYFLLSLFSIMFMFLEGYSSTSGI